ncbi:ubiquitin carboxyl-terminal hydrolase-domain-containing protein [Lipomyces oligophaga]|uniref:ubiquitin carboxyl-terminal hydrolase-domain-containing protein n=1 Tax=Lipomyces oligophaga TaxID=45792 RepID=UPI0034CE29B3
MDGWQEIYRTSTGPRYDSIAAPISALAFDTSEELLWTGDEQGRLASFAGPSLRKYTSYKGHRSAVLQILHNDRGTLSLSSNSFRLSQRRGLVRYNLEHENLKDATAMCYSSRGTSEIVIAKSTPGLLRVNVDRGTLLSEVASDAGISVMRRGSRLICAGSVNGDILLIDPNSMRVVRKITAAHSSGVADLDTRDNVLLTCGHTHRGTSYLLDPLLNIYDLRTFRPQPPVPFPAGAAFVRLHPKMSTTCLVSSMTGQLQMLDYANPANAFLYQAAVPYISGLEFSSSGEYFALGSKTGHIQIWGSHESSQFTEFARATEWNDATPDTGTPISVDQDIPLNSVGMPYYHETLLSVWPDDMVFNVARPPPPIDSEILANMKTVDFFGYAPFPKHMHRYVTDTSPYNVILNKTDSKAPLFRSQRDKLQAKKGDKDSVPNQNTVDPVESFKKVEIQYSRFGVDDFDFKFYNQTAYSGLETHLQNSYTNSLLQIYRFAPPMYNFALQHVAGSCLLEDCLLCELGFLMDMLDKAQGEHCRAYNFAHTLSAIPQAGALGLLEDENVGSNGNQQPVGAMIQSFNRFLFERVGLESRLREMESSELMRTSLTSKLEIVAGITQLTTVRCGSCDSETQRHSTAYVTDLQYPKPSETTGALGGSRASGNLPSTQQDRKNNSLLSATSFCGILQHSLENRNHARGWCNEKCRRYQLLTTTKRVQSRLPQVLSINVNIDSHASRQIWNQKNFLPLRIGAELKSNGLKVRPFGMDNSRSGPPIQPQQVYELLGVVVEINFGVSDNHLVSLIRVPNNEGVREWYLFNDFLVTPFPAIEALKFDYTWKSPVMVVYINSESANLAYDQTWRQMLETSLLTANPATDLVFQNPNFEYECLTKEEAPTAGTIVAIDAEFVRLQEETTEVRSDGSRHLVRPSRWSLARVSVVRGEGPKAGVAFIDDYITTTDEIVDYLTEFSGIEVGDLDPSRSKKRLVPLKIAYKKLWLLLNLKVVFVGHGLINDFRTINIQVPKQQVIDTLDIYYIKSRQRKLSLRFLAWYLLHENIQAITHDSIEDAKTALFLYNKYEEFIQQGGPEAFDDLLNEIYTEGRAVNFKPPTSMPSPVKSTA